MTTINCSGIDYLALMARIAAEIDADDAGPDTLDARLAAIETPMLVLGDKRRIEARVDSLRDALAMSGKVPEDASVH